MYKLTSILFLLCATTTLVMNGEVPESLREMGEVLHAHCVAATNVPEKLIDDANAGIFSEDNSFQCYLRCIYDETSLITDDGHFDADALLSVFPPELQTVLADTLKSCAANTPLGKDECESMWLVSKCFYNTDPVNYFLF